MSADRVFGNDSMPIRIRARTLKAIAGQPVSSPELLRNYLRDWRNILPFRFAGASEINARTPNALTKCYCSTSQVLITNKRNGPATVAKRFDSRCYDAVGAVILKRMINLGHCWTRRNLSFVGRPRIRKRDCSLAGKNEGIQQQIGRPHHAPCRSPINPGLFSISTCTARGPLGVTSDSNMTRAP